MTCDAPASLSMSAATSPVCAPCFVSVDPAGRNALIANYGGGTLAVAGIHLSRIPALDYDADLFQERTLRSVTANTRADGRDFLAVAAAHPLRVTVTPYPLDAADRALADLAADRVDGAAVLVP